jgi:hypothetical protein
MSGLLRSWPNDVAERVTMNKPKRARPLADVLRKTLNDAFAQQGFASTELITRWPEIVGAEIAAHSEPEKIRWPRRVAGETPEPATLLLRVEGPTAIEIQHLSSVILERVNRFFGWQAVAQLALRQAPLTRRPSEPRAAFDSEATARIAATLGDITDDALRDAVARLGAAVKPG